MNDRTSLLEATDVFAARIATGAAERDAGYAVPTPEIAELRASGLLAAAVPVDAGGTGADVATITEVVRRISVADPSIAQILQPHFVQVERARRAVALPAYRRHVLEAALAGELFASAHAERGGADAQAISTRLIRGTDGIARLTGEKFYATGSAVAQWLTVGAADDAGQPISCLVATDAQHVTICDDWRAIGQRGTTSGTVQLHAVVVDDRLIFPKEAEAGAVTIPWNQLLHIAVDLGIADAAFADALSFLRDAARTWSTAEAEGDRAQILERVGRLGTRIEAAHALFDRAVVEADAAREGYEEALLHRARTAVAMAKTFVTEAALDIASALFDLGGARSAQAAHAFDRHWRNARTHSLHIPDRWLLRHLGDRILNAAPFPAGSKF